MVARRQLDFSAGAPASKRLKRLERKVASSSPSLRYKDFLIPNAQLDNTYNFKLLEVINQGDTQADRTGNTIRVKKVEIFTNFVSENDRLRMVLHSPRDTGDIPTIANNEPFNMFFDQDKFRIWDDARNMGVLNSVDQAASEYGGRNLRVSKTFAMPMKSVYKNNTTDVNHNDLLLTIFKEGGQGKLFAGDSNLKINVNGRIWFYDT